MNSFENLEIKIEFNKMYFAQNNLHIDPRVSYKTLFKYASARKRAQHI